MRALFVAAIIGLVGTVTAGEHLSALPSGSDDGSGADAEVRPYEAEQQASPHPNPPPQRGEESGGLTEIYRLRIVNDSGGEIAASRDGGATWSPLGRVLRWTEKVNPRAFAASSFAPIGSVAATSVNALHIKADHNPETDRAATFSLLPEEFLGVKRAEYESFLSPDSSIYTDIAAGEGIFGGGWAPLVGDPVGLETPEGLAPLPRGYVPRRGDAIVIRVLRPARYPAQVIFENRFQGLITLQYPDGSSQVIGTVLRPVVGVGRFPGSLYAGIGRIRASHPGVIDVSVSPQGRIGAFQIIPAAHAMDPGTTYMRVKTQWMVVGPVCSTDASWEGVAPLFLRHIQPAYRAQDLRDPDWEARLLAHFLVEARVEGEWGPMPAFDLGADANAALPEWAETALLEVEALRIWFPLPPGEPDSPPANE